MSYVSNISSGGGGGSGTVTSITQGTGITLTPSPITTTGSVALTIPVTIALGGTNATSMATTDGVVYFDGTRLVTTAVGSATQVLTSNGAGVAPTFQAAGGGGITTIDGDSGSATGATVTIAGGSGISTSASGSTITITNSAPAAGSNVFLAFMNSGQANVTGAGTQTTVVFNDVSSNPGSYYDTGTGMFTAPATGNYLFTVAISTSGTSVGASRVILLGEAGSIEYKLTDQDFVLGSASGSMFLNYSFMARLTATQTCYIQLRIFNGVGNTIGVGGSSGGSQYISFFNGYYVSA